MASGSFILSSVRGREPSSERPSGNSELVRDELRPRGPRNGRLGGGGFGVSGGCAVDSGSIIDSPEDMTTMGRRR